MNIPARADDLVTEISAALPAEVHVTADPNTIPAALADGRQVVAIQPPDLAFPTWTTTEVGWEAYVIAGQFADQRKAWEAIDAIITELAEPLALESAKPASYAHPSMPEHPAYVLTFTETL